MTVTLTLLDLAGAVALLLWGVHMVQTGVQRDFCPDPRRLMGTALRNRLAAFAAGIGVTAILQSSTATGLMLTGFTASGALELVPALAVMLGANVGTTLIVQVLSFDVASVAPVLVLVGVMVFRRAKAARGRDLGRVAIGLGLMLMALKALLSTITPYEDQPNLHMLLGAVADEPVLDVILAAGLTWAAHSSVTVVLLVMSFATKGSIPPHAAYALVLGANLGSAINPVVEGSANDPVARRLPVGNLINRLLGCAVGLAVLPWVGPWLAVVETSTARAVADFHTGFNVVLAVVFLPLLTPFASLLRRVLPKPQDPEDPGRARYLDSGALETPSVALANAAREALRVSDTLEQMLRSAAEAITRGNRTRIADTRRLDDIIDRLNVAIGTYVTALDEEAMSESDHRRLSDILIFTSNLESAGDVLDRDVMGTVARRLKRGDEVPQEERAEITTLLDRLSANLRAASALFLNADSAVARTLVTEKEVFREREMAETERLQRVRGRGAGEPVRSDFSRLELLRAIKQVNGYLIAASAYPVLESQGDLLPSRLRTD